MEEQRLKLGESTIYTKIFGKGEPLVFLHGGPGGEHRYFLPHLQELSKEFTLVFYDQRGCGQSEHKHKELYTLEGEVETLEELRKCLGIQKLNLVGESWGTMLSLLYTAKYPNKVNKIFMTAAVGATMEGFLRFGVELENRLTTEERELLKKLSVQLEKNEVDVKEIFKIIDPYYVYSPKTLTRRTPTKSNPEVNSVLSKEIIENYDVSKEWDKFGNIPILVAQGDHDIIAPSILEEVLIKYIPHIDVRIIENCGHWSIIEQPERLQAMILDFFKGNDEISIRG
jgi:proline iminopeptidase